MPRDAAKPVTVDIDGTRSVSGLLREVEQPQALLVLAHGAGAGMGHPFMCAVSEGLAARQVASLRYQFPYMEKGSKRPDPPAVAQATVRAAVDAARAAYPATTLFAGGKSYGGRMTSQAQATRALEGVRGLAFLGFPLHPAGKPSDERAAHLADVRIPMLFLQGTKDDLADLSLLQPVVQKLGAPARLETFEEADHSFHVPKRSGRTDAEVIGSMLDALAAWMKTIAGDPA
ncbi:MAG TPA: alpha/beta family hydrolase [Nevskiaceae bacterium]|nr:alpha/beta family hydrolase [Nevskiaceae bacterium]